MLCFLIVKNKEKWLKSHTQHKRPPPHLSKYPPDLKRPPPSL